MTEGYAEDLAYVSAYLITSELFVMSGNIPKVLS